MQVAGNHPTNLLAPAELNPHLPAHLHPAGKNGNTCAQGKPPLLDDRIDILSRDVVKTSTTSSSESGTLSALRPRRTVITPASSSLQVYRSQIPLGRMKEWTRLLASLAGQVARQRPNGALPRPPAWKTPFSNPSLSDIPARNPHAPTNFAPPRSTSKGQRQIDGPSFPPTVLRGIPNHTVGCVPIPDRVFRTEEQHLVQPPPWLAVSKSGYPPVSGGLSLYPLVLDGGL